MTYFYPRYGCKYLYKLINYIKIFVSGPLYWSITAYYCDQQNLFFMPEQRLGQLTRNANIVPICLRFALDFLLYIYKQFSLLRGPQASGL